MSYQNLENSLVKIISWFENEKVPYALIGGLAVSFRTIERATRDIDIALAFDNDSEVEKLILSLQNLGYYPETLINQTTANKIATVRMLSQSEDSIYLDLLFASSGIEAEVVQSATKVELISNLQINIADIPSLIALKTLSANDSIRIQDKVDLKNLLSDAKDSEVTQAEKLLELITERGYNRNKNLKAEFKKHLENFRNH